MKPDASNLRKRKLLAAAAEELGLPTPKHACCEATVSSVRDSLFLNGMNAEDVAESTQGSNSFAGYSQSSSTGLIFDERFQKRASSDEASTSRGNTRSVTSGNDSYSLESRMLSYKDYDDDDDDDDDDEMEEYPLSHQKKLGWHDIDCLEDCIDIHYSEETKQKTAVELEEFLSSSGVNTTLSSVLSSERWIVDQEAELARRKPTIDQEFEQYFSTLML